MAKGMMGMKRFWIILIAVLPAAAADNNALLDSWLAAQSQLKTWSADLTQTRTMKTLKHSQQAKGHLIFQAPNNFRWELTSPSQTIAIRNADDMTVIYPKLKRAERYPLGGAGNEPWRDALALMDAGFPESRVELDKRFKLLSVAITNDLAHIVMEPKSAMAKKFMDQVELFLRTNDFSMAANQLRFADGSIMRNDFTNTAKNPVIPPHSFHAEIPADYKIIEPLKK